MLEEYAMKAQKNMAIKISERQVEG